ncbi:dnaJ protein ERDJ3A [Rutidosis leptorrhynchoides]|uniref:dnaJ protein ERDJ3A n=1 Tax=Rutidosis leptorrhynchoides TaxID=125765 RepID=UPI003A9A5F16
MKNCNNRILSSIIIVFSLLIFISVESKPLDPYKVLGVEKDASQRQIQKAFHKLSLQYHPDKNKDKGAQEKFAEINNAYDILSDEEKRKNYDMFGDERGSPGFGGEEGGNRGGHTFFGGGGGPGQSGFRFSPDEWQTMGGQSGGSKSYSFSFGGNSKPSSGSSFGFDIGDVFSNFFGGGMSGGGNQFGSFGNSGGSHPGSRSSTKSLKSINSEFFKKEVIDKGVTWILLSYAPLMKGKQHYELIIDEVSSSLKGALEVGNVNCEVESSLCKELGIRPRNKPRVYVYSYKASETGSLIEYTGDVTVKDLKSFVQDHLPRFSKRVTLAQFEAQASTTVESLPKVILLSTKKDTPVIWRALSGLYRKRFVFYDTQVQDVYDPTAKKLGVDEVPAVVGWLSNGEKQILKNGIHVKDMKSTIRDLSSLLEAFEKKNKKIASTTQSKKPPTDSDKDSVSLLTAANFNAVCGESTPVCIIGVFRSSKGREKLHSILSSVSQMSLMRRQNPASGPRDSVSYALLDASHQSSFLYAFDKSGFKSSDKLLIAYKPRKSKFSAFTGDITTEEVEKFIGSVLNGDVQFSKTRQKPVVK